MIIGFEKHFSSYSYYIILVTGSSSIFSREISTRDREHLNKAQRLTNNIYR